ncbi:MAG: cell division protein FtsZ [Flavobacteriaceae bacterium TMED200]|nr:cell division protein FtsZ [Flavobacteriaceae bacterium]OUW66634.1 MAG: cell division protein FtsZ [Flavobacteriaceae bacterium TMED200]
MNKLKENMEEGFNFDLPKNRSNVIKVIGVGGGGGNAINYMFKQGISGVDFVVCNTDSQALEKSPVPIKIQLGVSLTEGLGAGANPEIGSLAAKESEEEIKSLLSNQTKMVFITAGMGGGTGTGAAPIIAQMSKQIDILTVGIVTIPFQFEGRMRSEQAETGIEILRENVDSLIVINNNKLRQVYGNLGFKAGFAKADEVLATAARGIAEVITHHYRQNIDLKDAKTVLSNSGTAIMGSAVAEGLDRAEKSVLKALDSPLLNDNKIKGCKNVLLLIVSGEDEITIDEIGEINDLIQSEAGNNTNIIMGIGEDKNLEKGISVTIIATGFNSEQQHEIVNTEAKKIIHTLEEDQSFVQDLTDDEIKSKNKEKYKLDKQNNINKFSNEDLIRNDKLNFSKTSSTENDRSLDSKNNSFEENDLTKDNLNTKDIETTTSQVSDSFNEEVNENESEDPIEILDFEEINDLDPPQFEFDFNESLDSSKNTEVKKSNLEHDYEINSFEVSNQNLKDNAEVENLVDNPEVEDLDDNLEMENPDMDDLNIKIKNPENDEISNGEKIEVDVKEDTPFDNSIEETLKNSNNSSKEELKKFNYSFQNNTKRINEMDKQPAYKRLGYNIDQNIENEKKSPLTLDKDINDEVQLRSNNSFLHDNVD